MTSDLRQVDQAMDYAIIALSLEGKIRSWNAGAARITGFTHEEAIGQPFSIFDPAEDLTSPELQRLLDEARGHGRAEYTGWRTRRDRSRFWGGVIVTALHDDADALTGYVAVTRDLTEQHALEDAVRKADERMRVFIDAVTEYAIIALSPDGTIESWNAGARRLKGFTQEEAVGQNFSIFYPPEERQAGQPQRLLDQARASGNVEHTGWRIRKDGTRFWAGVNITALYDTSGTLTGYVKVTRDLTGPKLLEMAQDTFYNTFEHDFRIPIAAIKGFAELIRDAGPEDRDRFLDRVQANADRALGMLEQLVDYARLRSGRIPIRIQDVHLAELTRQVVANLSHQTSRIQVKPAQVVVLADRIALERVIANVLGNAVKYSDRDSAITCTAEQSRDHGILRITDHGRGIDEADLDWIFNEYERGRMPRDDDGTGLGLASARQFMRLQGGTISIASEVGVGTTVTIRLPLAHAGERPETSAMNADQAPIR